MSLVFELPLPENRANASRVHWASRHKRRKEYFALLDALVTTKQNPRPPGMPWKKTEAEIQLRTWRQQDPDNAHARLKDPIDWLQTRGYLMNDRDLTYKLDVRTALKRDLGITLVLREVA